VAACVLITPKNKAITDNPDGAGHDAPFLYPEGALLACLASRFVRARVSAARGSQVDLDQADQGKRNRTKTVAQLLQKLHIGLDQHINPRRDRFLLTFLPGYGPGRDPTGYQGAELVEELCQQTNGLLPVFGGVASPVDEAKQQSFQFVGGQVYTG